MRDFKKVLDAAEISITDFQPQKAKPIFIGSTAYSVKNFTEKLRNSIGAANCKKYDGLLELLNDEAAMLEEVSNYADNHVEKEKKEFIIPESLKHLTLNIDTSSKKQSTERYFCTTKDELRETEVSGTYFMERCGMSLADAVNEARPVIPIYAPRSKRGVTKRINPETESPHKYFNDYIPPAWELWRERNPKAWAKLPAKPPREVMTMLKHIIPNKKEREYFYAWVYTSLTTRAYVYLVLCGAPGVGKNRLRYLLSALHGANNSSAGKKETLGANGSRFNAQMSANTLLWFDELKYGPDMEPVMKEYQNATISIERKGVDATDRSEIYSSMVISNNYPRDNYLLFNSRKFAPLVLGDKALTYSLSSAEISMMSDKLDVQGKKFDVMYVAQIAKWLLRIGEKHTHKFPNLEYQGPKYWELAHTSMSRWQKIAVLALTVQNNRGPFHGWHEDKKAFLWSEVESALRKKKEYGSNDYRDATTIKAFFETYRDSSGGEVFEVEAVPKSVVQDFWVKPISGIKTIKGKISLDENGPDIFDEPEEKPSGPVRRRGMSDFEWQQEKKKFKHAKAKPEVASGKKAKRDTDYL